MLHALILTFILATSQDQTGHAIVPDQRPSTNGWVHAELSVRRDIDLHAIDDSWASRAHELNPLKTDKDDRLVVFSASASRQPPTAVRLRSVGKEELSPVGTYAWAVPLKYLEEEDGVEVSWPEEDRRAGGPPPCLEAIWVISSDELDAAELTARINGIDFVSQVANMNDALGRSAHEKDYQAYRAQFVAFDFLTHQTVQALRPANADLGVWMARIRADPAIRDAPHGLDARVEAILERLLKKTEATGHLTSARDGLDKQIKELIVGSTIQQGLVNADDEPDRTQDYIAIGNYMIDAMRILAPPRSNRERGLALKEDLLLFAEGRLRFSPPELNELYNGEPNGSLFFSFAAYFLECDRLVRTKKLEPSKDRPWLEWAETSLIASVLFVEAYKPRTMPSILIGDYKWTRGPSYRDDYKQFRQAVIKGIKSLERDPTCLRTEFEHIVKDAQRAYPWKYVPVCSR